MVMVENWLYVSWVRKVYQYDLRVAQAVDTRTWNSPSFTSVAISLADLLGCVSVHTLVGCHFNF